MLKQLIYFITEKGTDMNFGAILPHTLLFGGVKHYLEVAETIIRRGNSFTLFTPEGTPPNWCIFSGNILPLTEISGYDLDVLITSEESFLPELLNHPAHKKLFYTINENKALAKIVKHPEITFLCNSTRSFRHVKKKIGVTPYTATCGVNIDHYYPRPEELPTDPFVIMTYGRQSMKLKGTHLVKAACEQLYKEGYNIKLLLFDTVTDENVRRDIESFSSSCPFEFVVNHPVEKNRELYYRAHVFASAERKGTWANTASEAMACGIPVVASEVGSDDFLINNKTGLKIRRTVGSIARALKKLYNSKELRERLSNEGARRVTEWQWQISADQILALSEHPDLKKVSHLKWPFLPNLLKETPLSNKNVSLPESIPAGVYIYNYHAIVASASQEPWEEVLTESKTDLARFKEQIEWLSANMSPVPLTEIPNILKKGATEPFFAITFDDGFKNISQVEPLLSEYDITPTVFINSEIIDGKKASWVIQLSSLLAEGKFPQLKKALKTRFNFSPRKPKHIYRFVKESAQFYEVTALINEMCKTKTKRQFLSWDELRELHNKGWHIGNHTLSHASLQGISFFDQQREIEENIIRCTEERLEMIPWLAFPYGSSEHVNGGILNWLYDHREWFGVFANGGFNTHFAQREILRMGIGNNTLDEFKLITAQSIDKTLQINQNVKRTIFH